MRNQSLVTTFAALIWATAAMPASADDSFAPASRPRPTEIVEMISAIAGGAQMGPGRGWFHAGQSRYGWQWLAARYDANRDGKISRQEFGGPAELFERLDRNHDGLLTASDFDLPESRPQPARPTPTVAATPPAPGKRTGLSGGDGPSPQVMLQGLLSGELGSMFEGPDIGQPAPDFALKTQDGVREIRMSEFRGKKPVVLVFGSFT